MCPYRAGAASVTVAVSEDGGPGLGRLQVSRNICQGQLWQTTFYRPPHEIHHHAARFLEVTRLPEPGATGPESEDYRIRAGRITSSVSSYSR